MNAPSRGPLRLGRPYCRKKERGRLRRPGPDARLGGDRHARSRELDGRERAPLPRPLPGGDDGGGR
ncbi:MAG: hypothetical protein CL479_04635, partial [Acidobacteria bacterium]|nr:hypothetical protein [Acidobacteriota bacterium]